MDLTSIQKIINSGSVVETDFGKATAYFTLDLNEIVSVDFSQHQVFYALIHNTLYPFAVISDDNGIDFTPYLIPEMDAIVYVNTYVMTNTNDRDAWEIVGEATNPYELISNGTLREGDVVRFTSAYDDSPVTYIPEIGIGDPDGIFLVAQELSDFSEAVYDSVDDFFKHDIDCCDEDDEVGEDVPGDEDDDNDTDEYQTDDEDDLADELTFIAAGPVIAYLHRYGEQISWAKDIIEKNDNDDSFVNE